MDPAMIFKAIATWTATVLINYRSIFLACLSCCVFIIALHKSVIEHNDKIMQSDAYYIFRVLVYGVLRVSALAWGVGTAFALFS